MRGPGLRKESVRDEEIPVHKLRNIRWGVIIFINGLFFVSFYLDIQVLEGSLSGSRFLGFHLIDIFSGAQIMVATQHVAVNLVVGMVTVFVIYLLLGGRTFCSWVCPYNLLAEWAEPLHQLLVRKKIVRNRNFDYNWKYYFLAVFLVLAWFTGFTIFETFSPISMISRALVYGPGLGLLIVAGLLALEIFYSKRFWCRYVCPVGTTYNLIGRVSPLKIKWNLDNCSNCKECQVVCPVPFVLADTVNRNKTDFVASGECTRCGLCVDACQDGALNFSVRYLDKII